MRKRNFVLTAGACLATLTLTVGTAGADPMGTPVFRDLAGVGADGPQGVMNALSEVITINGNKVIGSYDSVGTNPITTKDRPAPNPCTFNRPTSGGAGITALNDPAKAGCLQFARQTTDDSQNRPGQNLTYIPYAIDALAYVIRDNSTIFRDLSLAELTNIYNCQVPGAKPLLGSFGAGTRRLFLQRLGFTDAEDFVRQPNHTCIQDGVSENQGIRLTDPGHIAPHSIAQFLSQSNALVPDLRARTNLGSINTINPALLNPSVPGAISYVIRDNSPIFRDLSRAEIQAIYGRNGDPGSPACQGLRPLLPPVGSATRNAFVSQVLTPTVPGSCVRDVAQENQGILLTDPGHIAPHSIPQYLSQANALVPDVRGRTNLGAINGINPAVLNNSSTILRDIFNVVPTGRIGAGTTENAVFVDNNPAPNVNTSPICNNPDTIRRFGFNTNPNCGSTTIRTP